MAIYLTKQKSITHTETSLTLCIFDNELGAINLDILAETDDLRFPRYSPSKRALRQISYEASAAVCGNDARDGFVRSKVLSRMELPNLKPKVNIFKFYEAIVTLRVLCYFHTEKKEELHEKFINFKILQTFLCQIGSQRLLCKKHKFHTDDYTDRQQLFRIQANKLGKIFFS